jgi:hypothetical protein
MNCGTQRLCAWTAPVIAVMFFIGLMIAGFLPPLDPGLSAEQLAQVFLAHPERIRIGLLICLLGSGLTGPLVAVIAVQLKRIEGQHSPLTYAQLVLGVFIPIVIMLPLSWWMTAAYRADRDPQAIQVLSDQGWMWFVGCLYPAATQWTCIGIAILRDTADRPVFPRWLGYLNLWCAAGSLPAVGIYFVKSGPFAWNGVLSWWLPVTVFGVWLLAMFYGLLTAIGEQERTRPTEVAASPDLDQIAARVIELMQERQTQP